MIFSLPISLGEESCVNCGVHFAMPQSLQLARKTDKKQFFCPNGHSMTYTRTTEDELREKLAAAERNRDFYQAARDERMSRSRGSSGGSSVHGPG
jgi:hypothetical protein